MMFIVSQRLIPRMCTRRMCSSHSVIKRETMFFQPSVQSLLQKLTGMDYDKVFRRRRLGDAPERPVYQFMTEEELREVQDDIHVKATQKLSSPPVMEERENTSIILEEDDSLVGFDTAKYVFTDITFGVPDRSRMIVVREPTGTLRTSNWEEQDRINQVYFPKEGRRHYIPAMFDTDNLTKLLGPDKYEYILDRNCLQFEPDHSVYLRTVDAVYNHIVDNGHYDVLHSTRHYGPMVFSLCWNKRMDDLLAHLVLRDRLLEAVDTVKLYCEIHKDCKMDNIEELSVEDVIRNFAKEESSKGGKVTMALDRLLETRRSEENLKTSHGIGN